MKTTISVIMAAYNAEKTIRAAIESVQKQTYPCWELLIVDDGSRDNTLAIARQYAEMDHRIRVICNGTNSGVSQSRKNALLTAVGEWIAVLDSDDMWAPEKLEKQLEVAKEKGAALIFTGSAFVRADGSVIPWTLHVPKRVGLRQLLKQNVISNSSALVKRNLYERHYVMGDHLHEDYAMWLGMLAEGVEAYGIDEPLLIYRVASTTKSGNKLKSARMQLETYRYIGLSVPERLVYMCLYGINGYLKHRHLK